MTLSYNLQLSTDAHEKAIVALSLSSSANDQTLLEQALEVMEETTGLSPISLWWIRASPRGPTSLPPTRKSIDLIGPMRESSAGKDGALHIRGITEDFSPDKFLFDPERNVLICPQGKLPVLSSKREKPGKTIYYYLGKECATCPSKPSCCPKSKRGRIVMSH